MISYGRERWSRSHPIKLWHRASELIYPRGRIARCIVGLPAKSKLFLMISVRRDIKKKKFAHSVVAYSLSQSVLMCSSNETKSGEIDVIGVTTWLCL